MHSSGRKEEDETEFKRTKTEKNEVSTSQKTKHGLKKSKPTNPSVIELLCDKDIQDNVNDTKLCEEREDEESTMEQLNTTETSIQLNEEEHESSKLKIIDPDKEGIDRKCYPKRLKNPQQMSDVEDESEKPATSKRVRYSRNAKHVNEGNVLDSDDGDSELNAEIQKSEDVIVKQTIPVRSRRKKTASVNKNVLLSVTVNSVTKKNRIESEKVNIPEVTAKSKGIKKTTKIENVKENKVRYAKNAKHVKEDNVLDSDVDNSKLNAEIQKSEDVTVKQTIPLRSKRKKTESVNENVLSVTEKSELNSVTENNLSESEKVKESKLPYTPGEPSKFSRSKRLPTITKELSDSDVPISSKKRVNKTVRQKGSNKQIRLVSSNDDTCSPVSEVDKNIFKETKSSKSKRNIKRSKNINSGGKDVCQENEQLSDILATESIVKNKTDKKVKNKSKQKDVSTVIKVVENTTEQLDHNLTKEILGTPRRLTGAGKPKIVFTGMDDKSYEKVCLPIFIYLCLYMWVCTCGWVCM